jgi:hypothetical protein
MKEEEWCYCMNSVELFQVFWLPSVPFLKLMELDSAGRMGVFKGGGVG